MEKARFSFRLNNMMKQHPGMFTQQQQQQVQQVVLPFEKLPRIGTQPKAAQMVHTAMSDLVYRSCAPDVRNGPQRRGAASDCETEISSGSYESTQFHLPSIGEAFPMVMEDEAGRAFAAAVGATLCGSSEKQMPKIHVIISDKIMPPTQKAAAETERKVFFRYALTHRKPKQFWTTEEDEKLQSIVREHGAKNWQELANQYLPHRSGVQLRARWAYVVGRRGETREFSADEDRFILRSYQEHGGRWSCFARLLGECTDQDVKLRFRKLMRIVDKEGTTDISSDAGPCCESGKR